MGVPEFTVDVFQNEYLPAGGREVNAVVTVTSACSTADRPAAAAGAAEIIIVDCSGSMAKPTVKMIQAREAAAAAIDVIRDGVAFAVVSGTSGARPVYPEAGSLAVADERTREAAKGSLARLQPGNGTAIGNWLRYARELFETREDTLRHAILLTDGQNHQHPGRLAAEITLADRMTRCGHPGCRCHADPPRLHGPYHQWTRKKNRRTATRILTDDQLADYAPWFDNHRRLRELITELEELSLAIAEADPRWNR